LTLLQIRAIAKHDFQMGESLNDCEDNHEATEGATAPETLRSKDHLKDKMLESGPYW